MIKKYSSGSSLEIELLYSRILKTAQDQMVAETDPQIKARWIAALEKMASAHTNSQILNMVGMADEAGNKINESLNAIKNQSPEEKKLSLEIVGALGNSADNMAYDGKVKKGSLSHRTRTIKYMNRFMNKYSKLKTDEERFLALKKAKVMDENSLVKIGLTFYDEDRILKFAQDETGGEDLLSNAPAATQGVGSLLSGWSNRLQKWMKGTTTAPGTTPPPATYNSWKAKALGISDDVIAKIKRTPGLFGKLYELGLGGIGKILKSIAKWWVLIQGLLGLAQMTYVWWQVSSADLKNIGLGESWGIEPLWSSEVLEQKLATLESNPEKFGSLGYICELGRIFWERAAGIASAVINIIAAGFAGAILSSLGPIGFIVGGIFVSIIAEYMELDKKLLEWMSKGHAEVSAKVRKIIEIKAGLVAPEGGAIPKPTGPKVTTPAVVPTEGPERPVTPPGEKPPEKALQRTPIKFEEGEKVTVNQGFEVIDQIKLGVVFQKREVFKDNFVYAISYDNGGSYYLLAKELNGAIAELEKILGNKISKPKLENLKEQVQKYQDDLKKEARKKRKLKRKTQKAIRWVRKSGRAA
jgi:hypothetical protein